MSAASLAHPDEELRGLIAALREDTLDREQEMRLQQLLAESDAALRTYIRAIAMQADLYGYLVAWVAGDPIAETIEPEAESQFQDALYGQSVFSDALQPHADDEAEALTAPVWKPASAEPRRDGLSARAWSALGFAAAAALMIGVAVWFRVRTNVDDTPRVAPVIAIDATPPGLPAATAPTTGPVVPEAPVIRPVVATFSASVDAAWGGPDAPHALGAALKEGSRVALTRGYAALTYRSGVAVVVEAPAEVVLESDSRLVLTRGRLTANVPEPARGFTVGTNRVDVVDLGTEFGVSVAADGTVDVPVFTGYVEARFGNMKPTSVRAGQAGRASDAGLKVAPVTSDADAFVRDIRNIRAPLPVRGTGQGLKIGDAEPDWTIIHFGRDPAWKPRATFVCGEGPRGLANDARSGWISLTGERPSVAGGMYTFATSFDLGKFDHATAKLRLRLAVDDFVREVRLNDHPTEIKLSLPGTAAKDRLHDFDITTGFVPGVNRLEIVVENGYGAGPKGQPNPMALRAELSGTAVRKVETAKSE